ncbi:NPAS4 protein, partial [Nesospiza acunhae]|nr:NPAS4 protein [Nesospiza acunhae]
LGYSRAELLGRSWYRLLHPEDLGHVARQHLRLAGAGPEARGEVVTRLQRKDGLGWTWVYTRLRPEGPALLAHNFVIRSVPSGQCPAPPVTPGGRSLLTALSPATADPGLGSGIGLGHGAAATADPGLGSGIGLGHGAAATADPGLGATIGHSLGAALGSGVEPGLGSGIGHGLGH